MVTNKLDLNIKLVNIISLPNYSLGSSCLNHVALIIVFYQSKSHEVVYKINDRIVEKRICILGPHEVQMIPIVIRNLSQGIIYHFYNINLNDLLPWQKLWVLVAGMPTIAHHLDAWSSHSGPNTEGRALAPFLDHNVEVDFFHTFHNSFLCLRNQNDKISLSWNPIKRKCIQNLSFNTVVWQRWYLSKLCDSFDWSPRWSVTQDDWQQGLGGNCVNYKNKPWKKTLHNSFVRHQNQTSWRICYLWLCTSIHCSLLQLLMLYWKSNNNNECINFYVNFNIFVNDNTDSGTDARESLEKIFSSPELAVSSQTHHPLNLIWQRCNISDDCVPLISWFVYYSVYLPDGTTHSTDNTRWSHTHHQTDQVFCQSRKSNSNWFICSNVKMF